EQVPPAEVPAAGISTVVDGLVHPWDIGFTPDGRMLFTERPGPISVLEAGSRRVLADPGDVVARGEVGMMGLAVDPSYADNRRIYVCMGTEQDVRVVRWRVNAEVTALEDRTDILTGIP